jgi:hypothetical protein
MNGWIVKRAAVTHRRCRVGRALVRRSLGVRNGVRGWRRRGLLKRGSVRERGGRRSSGGAHHRRAGKHTRANQTNNQGAR